MTEINFDAANQEEQVQVPAVAGALYKFDGIRRTKLPMKDSPAAKAILGKK